MRFPPAPGSRDMTVVGLVEAREEAKVRPSVEWEASELTSLELERCEWDSGSASGKGSEPRESRFVGERWEAVPFC